MSILTVATSLLLLTTSPWLPSSATSAIIPDGSQSSTMTCNSCCQGQAGIPGVPGSAGIPGSPGGFGPQGPAGPKGDILSVKGHRGEAGQLGPQGPRGEVGLPGLSVKGERGEVGGRGLPGPRGELGLRGLPGKVGPMGIQGPRGDGGLNGAVGNQGPKGERGEPTVGSFAGFTVTKTRTQSAGVGIATFDSVISDVAGDYDTNTNKFTCSVPGYYMFTFSIGVRGSKSVRVSLLHNGNTIVGMLTYPYGATSSYYRSMGTNSALILLAAGDQVWLHNDHNYELYTGSSWKWTTFTGVLLHAM